MTNTELPSAEQLAEEVRNWLRDNYTPLPKNPDPWTTTPERIEWLEKVLEAGYAVPTYPVEWFGRGYPNKLAKVIAQEFAAVKAPGACQDRYNIPANTTLALGTEQLKKDLLRDFLVERSRTCLLYSEPGAGSDLASVRTTATRDGDEWVVTGQKVWTSGAQTADYALLLARTDWDVPKHKGLSLFIMPMKQPGIEVRPLVQITGESHFNEVFINDAKVPHAYLLGEEGNGWRALQVALAYERSIMGDTARTSRSKKANTLIDLAREHGKLDDAAIRDQLATVLAMRELNRLNNARAKASTSTGTSSSIMSLGKLAMSKILHTEAALKTKIIGAQALLSGPENPVGDDVNFQTLNAFFTSIGGGTDQIQRNIIGERVLGLPKEPETDRDIPFRQARRS
ncbi:acyl-CoA dehydrogenase [Mycolicibacterium phlei]|uniref:Acyl-CoA dehydrogenase n=1 Tax=Mycolicibacterium phlei DSM 43239 = CCUG 21000 TaxID=1226750 RepID=A0A5N5UYK8_MYCPH|nr:acyl-CoA dehydrogenase family protein [Mycolicibacterium phlei]VEG11966.1 acyl-CoA dehydrogenase [Mycobacteroides chelonae]AMO63877.1 Glutaryl-CoA dehydrogenase [Mycolicibacterium phlei]EID09216.1 acyl-CoA dehydrogenase domain-containing protein [Mycolicibacterium phlei RIVM601174]KAB7754735.1 acyl-CoA dehydrogenase [Mycolicibacterium phlei DSM 43239 = CCUG 21000]KXW65380.1 acyl-CoA dehydrogenase [Mycolicibacterium phlei DSM 43239 = CCUG 21000]